MMYLFQLFLSVALDALFGDPRWYPHPVRIIGRVCLVSEKITRAVFSNLHIAGLITVLSVLLITGSSITILLLFFSNVSPLFASVISVVLIYMAIAARDLLLHSNDVYKALVSDDSIETARLEIAKIVGRDTKELDADGVSRACIETVAENMVDGITAPLFWAVIMSFFSPLLGLSPIEWSAIGVFLYKAINTMDSMIAYKNEKYLEFGFVAAKLDDIVNYLPARLSGVCVVMAAFLLKFDYRNAAKIFLRDRKQHSSPNAAHTESAVAGALNIRLGGPSRYFNTVVEKPYMGEDTQLVVPKKIQDTNLLVIVGSIIFLFFLILVRFFFQ